MNITLVMAYNILVLHADFMVQPQERKVFSISTHGWKMRKRNTTEISRFT
jgi:hypothetical protein